MKIETELSGSQDDNTEQCFDQSAMRRTEEANNDQKEVWELSETYWGINGTPANHGSYRHGTITEMVRPTDPSQALIQSSGNYVIHAVGIIVIAFFWEKGGLMQCHKQAWNGEGKPYGNELHHKPTLNQTAEENFLNQAVHNMLCAHIACFVLLFSVKLDILFIESMHRGLRSIFTFGSICIYLWYMFKAEFALRKYRPQYQKDSTKNTFMLLDAVWPKKALMKDQAADHKILGMVCSQSHEGNSMVILWLELFFFLTNIFILTGSLIGAWFDNTDVCEPKMSDKILVKDARIEGQTSFHIFSLQGFEMFSWGAPLDLGIDTKNTEAWKVKDLEPVDKKGKTSNPLNDEAEEVPTEDEDEADLHDGGENDEDDNDNYKRVDNQEIQKCAVDAAPKPSQAELQQKEQRRQDLSAEAKSKIDSMNEVIKGFKSLKDAEQDGKVKLFRVKANDLDDQTRQAVKDIDTLKFLYDGDISFRRFQAYMFFVSAVVLVFSDITSAAYMDVVLMRKIDDMSAWKGKKTYCAQQWSEDNYKGPIKVLILSHLILFAVLSLASQRKLNGIFWPVVFDYTKIRTSDLLEDFNSQFFKNLVTILLVLGATFAIAFTWEVNIKIDLPNYNECSATSDRRRHSICSAWLLTDLVMSFLTLFIVYFEFVVGGKDYTRKFRCRIMFAHNFAFEKFVETDSYLEKGTLVNIGLDQRLKDEIEKTYERLSQKGIEISEMDKTDWEHKNEKENYEEVLNEKMALFEKKDKSEEDNLRLEKLNFLLRKFDAELRYPVTIDKFVESIEIGIDLLNVKEGEHPVDPRGMRYLNSAIDVQNKDEKGMTDALKAEVDDNIKDLIKKLNLGVSMYDYAFWTFYHEYNPLMLFDLKMKVFMTFGVHMLVVIYAFVDKSGTFDYRTPYYGEIGIQLVRMVCAILLHLQYYPEVDKAIQMATFVIKNGGKFKSQTVAFPAIIALVKLLTSLIMEFGSLALFLYISSEMTLIKFYTQLAIIGAIESQMAAIMTTRKIKDEMDAKPIQYPVKHKNNNVVHHALKFFKNEKDMNPEWVSVFDKLTMFFLSLIIFSVSAFYTIYYYLIMFIPLLQMMISANTRRYAPEDAKYADAFPNSSKAAETAAK